MVTVWQADSASAIEPANANQPAKAALDYAVADSSLKVELLDSSAKESFLSVRVDPAGRIFVGGRESLFVYEPDDKGGYLPAKLLFKFPASSWVYDIEFRGNDLYVLTISGSVSDPRRSNSKERPASQTARLGRASYPCASVLPRVGLGPGGGSLSFDGRSARVLR